MLAAKGQNWAHLDAGQVQIEHEKGDARLGLAFIIGAHQAKYLVGLVGVGRPDLGAVNDEVVAIAFGAALQGDEI